MRPRITAVLSRVTMSLTLAACLWIGGPRMAWAQEDAPPDEPAADGKEDSPKVKVERGAGGKKVYVIKTGFVIEGRIQKPNAFYVLQRSQINYDWAALKQAFVPRILDSVRKSPF